MTPADHRRSSTASRQSLSALNPAHALQGRSVQPGDHPRALALRRRLVDPCHHPGLRAVRWRYCGERDGRGDDPVRTIVVGIAHRRSGGGISQAITTLQQGVVRGRIVTRADSAELCAGPVDRGTPHCRARLHGPHAGCREAQGHVQCVRRRPIELTRQWRRSVSASSCSSASSPARCGLAVACVARSRSAADRPDEPCSRVRDSRSLTKLIFQSRAVRHLGELPRVPLVRLKGAQLFSDDSQDLPRRSVAGRYGLVSPAQARSLAR